MASQPSPRLYMAKAEMAGGAAQDATIDTKAEPISMNVTVTYSLE